MSSRWRHAAFLGLLSLALLLSGCGRKTLPVPPQEVEPAPISDLRYHLNEQGATLLWTTPSRTVAGGKLPVAISGFEIFRAEIPEEHHCSGCPIPFGPAFRYDGAPPQPGETIRLQQSLLPGHHYYYKVRARYGWNQRGRNSNVISFTRVVVDQTDPRTESPPDQAVETNP